MVTIEQVELLESKVSRAIEYVKRLTAENLRLKDASSRFASENNMLHGKLDGYQNRIAELEKILLGFKKDQERIEQGIISALNRLNHFEDAVGGPADAEGAVSGNDAPSAIDTAGGPAFGSSATGGNDPLRDDDVLLDADTANDTAFGTGAANDAVSGADMTAGGDTSLDGVDLAANDDPLLGADMADGPALGSSASGHDDTAFGTGAANDAAFGADMTAGGDTLLDGVDLAANDDPLLDADMADGPALGSSASGNDDTAFDTGAANDAAFGADMTAGGDMLLDGVDLAANDDPLLDTNRAADNAPAFGAGLAANCDRLIGGESVRSVSAMVRPAPIIPQPPGSFPAFDRDITVEDHGEVAFQTPETADEPEIADIDGDEFLDLLRDNEPVFGQPAAAFHGDDGMPPHDTLEKPSDGPELDIF